MTKYATIVADPPWSVDAGPVFGDATGASRTLAYRSMTVEQIAALRVSDVALDGAHLYLWTINRYLRDAFDIAVSWGFKYSTTLVWAKKPMGNGIGGAYGISTEFVLFCRRGKLATQRDIGTTWFDWPRPYDLRGKPNHSGKPKAFLDMVEQVSPPAYLEMFARDNRLGWDSWGNECLAVELPMLNSSEQGAK
jgi:N6-adenosine-specific RNA methylase IME4